MYTSGARTTHIVFTNAQYFTGFALGIVAAGIGAAVLAIVAGWIVFGLRGPYFAIGTLGIADRGGGTDPVLGMGRRGQRHFHAGVSRAGRTRRSSSSISCLFALAFVLLVFLRWLYSTNFGLALNAIRDDEEKAEAMGLHTRRYKRTAWAISAVFLGIAGAIFGNMTGFIEPRDIAFPTTTFNLFMVVMVLLGGKGTLWGPVIGAVIFHTLKEVTWTYFLGWQFIALGLLDRRHHRLFPAGHRRLADGEISRAGSRRAARRKASRSARSARARAAAGGRRMSEAIIELDKRDQILRRRHRQPRGVADGRARRHHRADRPQRLRQDHAVQFHRRLSPDRFRLDPLRRPGNLPAERAGDRAARPAAHVPDHAHLRQDELHAEHADLDPAPQGGLARHVRARGRRGRREGRAPARLRRALRKALSCARARCRSASRSSWNSPWR